MACEILSPAQKVFAQKGGERIPLKIAALFSIGGSDRIRALIWKGGVELEKGMTVFDQDYSKHEIGSTLSLGDILPKAKWLDPLFSVVELSPQVSKELKLSLRKAAI